MDDWHQVMLKFQHLHQERKLELPPEAESQAVRHLELAKWVSREVGKNKLGNISANFFAAAMQVAYLLSKKRVDASMPLMAETFSEFSAINIE